MASKLSWTQALTSGEGPTSPSQAALLAVKGIAMGSADLVPGVSGGTIALITGIYNQLLHAISSVGDGIKDIFSLQIKSGLSKIHFRFLACLLSGIFVAIISLARLMHYLLETHPVPTWGSFFGLIAASILIIGKDAKILSLNGLGLFLIGAIGAFTLVGIIPVTTPQALWFIFLAGSIAICAMILPGISGSFLLLIMGKYQYITGAIKDPFVMEHILVIIVFGGGCVIGLLGFSRFLSYMMDHYQKGTMALLTGLMFGSMRKIWPWKETLETTIIRGKTHVLSTKNVLPAQIDGELYLTMALAAAGFILVLILQKISNKHT